MSRVLPGQSWDVVGNPDSQNRVFFLFSFCMSHEQLGRAALAPGHLQSCRRLLTCGKVFWADVGFGCPEKMSVYSPLPPCQISVSPVAPTLNESLFALYYRVASRWLQHRFG